MFPVLPYQIKMFIPIPFLSSHINSWIVCIPLLLSALSSQFLLHHVLFPFHVLLHFALHHLGFFFSFIIGHGTHIIISSPYSSTKTSYFHCTSLSPFIVLQSVTSKYLLRSLVLSALCVHFIPSSSSISF